MKLESDQNQLDNYKPSAIKSVDFAVSYNNGPLDKKLEEEISRNEQIRRENITLIKENSELTQKYKDLFDLASSLQKLLGEYQFELAQRDR